jgi:hypothetical protein
MKHGFGTEVDKYGHRYEGQWQLDEKAGQGKLTFIDGSTYEGGWKSGKFHGIGTLTYGETSMLNLASSDESLSNVVTGETTSESNAAIKSEEAHPLKAPSTES